jgi:hypothetical protein
VIDILVGVKNLPSSRESFDALAELDYQYAPYRADYTHRLCAPPSKSAATIRSS